MNKFILQVLGSLVPPAYIRISGVLGRTKKKNSDLSQTAVQSLTLNSLPMKNNVTLISIYKEPRCSGAEKKRTATYHRRLFSKKNLIKNLLLMENNSYYIYKEFNCLETEKKNNYPSRAVALRFIFNLK